MFDLRFNGNIHRYKKNAGILSYISFYIIIECILFMFETDVYQTIKLGFS
jgi:hypothetical protein